MILNIFLFISGFVLPFIIYKDYWFKYFFIFEYFVIILYDIIGNLIFDKIYILIYFNNNLYFNKYFYIILKYILFLKY